MLYCISPGGQDEPGPGTLMLTNVILAQLPSPSPSILQTLQPDYYKIILYRNNLRKQKDMTTVHHSVEGNLKDNILV